MDGVLVMDKPRGVTSFWVVQRVRRITGQRKAGHAGSLDPLATGLLLVCLGRATKIVQFLMEGEKVYRGAMTLGLITDTYDADGRVVEERPIPPLTLEQVQDAAAAFVGPLMQEPPPFSAAKHKGQPLYKLARRGITVKKEPRQVVVHSFEILAVNPPQVEFQVRCSKGTYVRSLAHELGLRLGCGAILSRLTRTGCGPFTLDDAVGLEELEEAGREGRLGDLVVPIARALAHLPAVEVERAVAQAVRQGAGVAADLVAPRCSQGGFVRLVSGGELVAVVPCLGCGEGGPPLLKPARIWPQGVPAGG